MKHSFSDTIRLAAHDVFCLNVHDEKLDFFSCLFLKLLSFSMYGLVADDFYGFTDVQTAPVTSFSSLFIDEGIYQLINKQAASQLIDSRAPLL